MSRSQRKQFLFSAAALLYILQDLAFLHLVRKFDAEMTPLEMERRNEQRQLSVRPMIYNITSLRSHSQNQSSRSHSTAREDQIKNHGKQILPKEDATKVLSSPEDDNQEADTKLPSTRSSKPRETTHINDNKESVQYPSIQVLTTIQAQLNELSLGRSRKPRRKNLKTWPSTVRGSKTKFNSSTSFHNRTDESISHRVSSVVHPNTLVVYSGPTSMGERTTKNMDSSMYKKNVEFFLENGVDCNNQDTALVLTKSMARLFRSKLLTVQKSCSRHNAVRILYREDKCGDMESVRVALDKLKLDPYEYFVYLNYEVVGPKFDTTESKLNKWTEVFTSMIDESVKMAGLSINCDIHPHVQSMAFATDKVGVKVIQDAGAVFDCFHPNDEKEIVKHYEVGMGKAIFEAGYGIRAVVGGSGGPLEIHPTDLIDNTNSELVEWCNDVWYPDKLPVIDTDAPWSGYIFFKSSHMFIFSDIQEDVQYDNIDDFLVIDAPEFSVGLSEEKEKGERVTTSVDQLWLGNVVAAKEDTSRLAGYTVSLVVSHCSKSLDWMTEYIGGITVSSITVYSKCGQLPAPKDLPKGAVIVELKNVGRIDHTMAYALARTSADTSDFLVFLKDNQNIHQPSLPRSMTEMLNIASQKGLGCFQQPSFGFSQYHVTEHLKEYSMEHYDGIPKINADTGEEVVNDSFEFKSTFANLGTFWEAMGIRITVSLVPVCYGGSFAVRRDRIRSIDSAIWDNLEVSLSRGDNIEEGHFAERTWAALFSEHLTAKETSTVLEQSDFIQPLLTGGGGVLAALVRDNARTG